MSEREGQRQEESPLESERGTTTVEDIVVRRIAGRAANEIPGIHMGGNTSRAAGGLFGRATGSSGDETRGVSAEVGRVETALDLTMAVDYDRNILQVVGRVREKVEERIRSLTGLKVTELNVTVSDVVFPDDRSREGAGGRRGELPAGGSEDDTAPVQEEAAPAQEEAAPVRPREPASRERTGREDVHVEGTPVDEGETAELRLGEEVRKRPSGERGEGSDESSGEGSGEGSGRRGGRRRDRRGRGGRGDGGDEGRRDR